jgi:phosphopantetheine adenylyltransferase
MCVLLQEPTQAELDPDMSALVVSVETLPGGTAINQGRLARGFAPLQLVTVALVGCENGNPTHMKLSSTQLRQSLADQQEHTR